MKSEKAAGGLTLKQAEALAKKVSAALAPACLSVEIAGEIRRGASPVFEIDLVAVVEDTACQHTLFEQPKRAGGPTLQNVLNTLQDEGRVWIRGWTLAGARLFAVRAGIWIQLVVCDPAALPVKLFIKTGSPAYVRRFLRQAKKRGVTFDLVNGRLGVDRHGWQTPKDEREIFRTCEAVFVKPEDRV